MVRAERRLAEIPEAGLAVRIDAPTFEQVLLVDRGAHLVHADRERGEACPRESSGCARIAPAVAWGGAACGAASAALRLGAVHIRWSAAPEFG